VCERDTGKACCGILRGNRSTKCIKVVIFAEYKLTWRPRKIYIISFGFMAITNEIFEDTLEDLHGKTDYRKYTDISTFLIVTITNMATIPNFEFWKI
jgi:hypothetical protein